MHKVRPAQRVFCGPRHQGAGKFISTLYDHVKVFRRKLEFLQKQMRKGDLCHFSACKQLIVEDQHGEDVLMLLRSQKYTKMFEKLQEEFQRRFCDFRSHDQDLEIFADPFLCDPECAPTNIQLELIEVQESSDLKSSFRDHPLDKFYTSLSALTYPALRKHATRMAFLFGSTYICKQTFSIMKFSNSKWRTIITDEHLSSVFKISTSNYEPRYGKLISDKSQLHISHNTLP